MRRPSVTARAAALALPLVLACPKLAVAAPSESPEPPPPTVSVPPPPTPPKVDPANYRMVLAGDIIIGLSGAAMIVMAVGLGIRSDAVTQRQALTVAELPDDQAIARQDQRIETGTVLAISGGASAAALLTTGITLVALGYRRERLRRVNLPQASLGPRSLSVTWTLRF